MKRSLVVLATLFVANGLCSQKAFGSIEPKAKQLIVAAADYLRNANTITLKGLATSQEVSSSNEKFQFDSTMEAMIVRPNKVFLRKSGYEDFALWYDGGTLTVMDEAGNKYSRVSVGGDVQAASAKLEELGIETPLSGLLSPDLGKNLDTRVRSGRYVGDTRILGVDCNHLALRQDDVDWQIWTDKATNAPRKIVVTSKMVTGSPEYTLLLTDLKAGGSVPDSTFIFKAPAGSSEVPVLSFGKLTP